MMKNIILLISFALLALTSKADQIKVTPDPRTNTLIVNAPNDIQQQIEALIKDLDEKRNQNIDTKVIQLKYTDSIAMSELLQRVLNALKPLKLKPSQMSIERSYDPYDYGLVFPATQNKIIIISDSGTILKIENIIKELDVKKASEYNSFVANIRNADAKSIAQIINNFNTRR